MDCNKLSAETRRLWERLEDEPLLAGFVLIGGTALTLRIAHRISEDLDFAYLGDLLPRPRIKKLIQHLGRDGFLFTPNQDTIAAEEFFDSGLDLDEHQQNYVTDTHVKVSFIRLDNVATNCLSGSIDSTLRVATLDEVFKTKSLVCAHLSKSRDWFDIYILLTRHGYTLGDMQQVFLDSGNANGFDIASSRLRICKFSLEDEGYAQLTDDGPTLDDLRAFFSEQLDKFEEEQAKKAFKAQKK